MEQVYDVAALNQNVLLLASSNFLYIVDRYEKELKETIRIDHPIVKIASWEDTFVVVSDEGSRYIAIMKLNEPGVKEIRRMEGQIVDIKISSTELIIATSEHL